MAIERVQRLRHLQADANVFIGLQGELTIVIETNEIRSHDGTTAGGKRILTKDQNDALYQTLNVDLQALGSFASGTKGILARIADGQYALRTLVQPAAGLTITNADGVAGNPTFVLSGELAGLSGLVANGVIARTGLGTYSPRTISSAAASLTVTNGDGVAGNPTLNLAGDLASLAGFGATTGMVSHTAANTYTLRTIASSSNNLVVSNGDGVAGNPSFGLALDLAALSGFAAGTGIPARTAANTWALRAITGSGNIAVTNGDGVAGAPTLDLTTTGVISAAYTFANITVDNKGRVFNATSNTLNDATNGGITITPATGAVTFAINIADLSAVTPAQNSTLAFETGAGTKKATLAGAANSLINIAAATKAQMQTGTDNTTVATPARVNDHDGTAKAWLVISSTGTNLASFNISAASRTGLGTYSCNFTTAFASANYVAQITTNSTGLYGSLTTQSTTGMTWTIVTGTTGSATDSASFLVCYGRQ